MFYKFLQVGRSLATAGNLLANSNMSVPSAISTFSIITRNVSFMKRLPATQLWNGVTGVSNAGRTRGRAKANRRARSKNLNKGQFIGVGSENIVWPGLNSPVIKANQLVKQQSLPPDPTRMEKLNEIRDRQIKFRRYKLTPLERGFSGHGYKGRKIGPPDPILGEKFEGFESIVLQVKFTCRMHGIFGRKRGYTAIVVTGNGNGIVGLGEANGSMMVQAINKAKNSAGQNLVKVNIENGSIPGSFVGAYHCTKVICERRSPGNGLKCQRLVAAICKVVGIENIRAKVIHSTNPTFVIKAFHKGIISQKSHQELAENKRLNIIDISGSYPKLVTRPRQETLRTTDEIVEDEELDVDLCTFKGIHMLDRKKFRPAFTSDDHYIFFMKMMKNKRYMYRCKQRLFIEHGEITNFLNEKYPGIKQFYRPNSYMKRGYVNKLRRENEGVDVFTLPDKHFDVSARTWNMLDVY